LTTNIETPRDNPRFAAGPQRVDNVELSNVGPGQNPHFEKFVDRPFVNHFGFGLGVSSDRAREYRREKSISIRTICNNIIAKSYSKKNTSS
jgi:hypothetical protein